jgi:hypothetical protein
VSVSWSWHLVSKLEKCNKKPLSHFFASSDNTLVAKCCQVVYQNEYLTPCILITCWSRVRAVRENTKPTSFCCIDLNPTPKFDFSHALQMAEISAFFHYITWHCMFVKYEKYGEARESTHSETFANYH